LATGDRFLETGAAPLGDYRLKEKQKAGLLKHEKRRSSRGCVKEIDNRAFYKGVFHQVGQKGVQEVEFLSEGWKIQ
jgi:hypothetical protein